MKDDFNNLNKCLCYKEQLHCLAGYEKVLDLKNAGLEIYQLSSQEQNKVNASGTEESRKRDTHSLFIFYNTKNVDLQPDVFLPEMEKRIIQCPRCRQILEHALKILQKVTEICKHDVIGICDHCKTKTRPCCDCIGAVQQFAYLKKGAHKMFLERQHEWLARIRQDLKKFDTDKNTILTKEIAAHKNKYARTLSSDNLQRVLPSDGDVRHINFKVSDQSLNSDSSITSYALETKPKSAVMVAKKQANAELTNSLVSDVDKRTKCDDIMIKNALRGKQGHHQNKVPHKNGLSSVDAQKENSVKEHYFPRKYADDESHDKDFSFTFPRGVEETNENKLQKSSSEVINDVHNAIREKKELLKSKGMPIFRKDTKIEKRKRVPKNKEEKKTDKFQTDKLAHQKNINKLISAEDIKRNKIELQQFNKGCNLIDDKTTNETKNGTKIMHDSKSHKLKKSREKMNERGFKGDLSSVEKSEINRKRNEMSNIELESPSNNEKQKLRRKEETIVKHLKDYKIKNLDESRIPRRQKHAQQQEPKETIKKELNIPMLKSSQNLLSMDLVKIKTDKLKERTLSQLVTKSEIKHHRDHHNQRKSGECPMCTNSNLELEYEIRKKQEAKKQAIIDGSKIKLLRHGNDIKEAEAIKPELFNVKYDDHFKAEIIQAAKVAPVMVKKFEEEVSKPKKTPTVEASKGVIRYALSDRSFIEKGWTMLPTEKVVRKMNVYRMRPSQPEFDWLQRNKHKRQLTHESGERLAEFDEDGRARLYYRNQRLALHYYEPEESNAQQRYVIFSNGEADERGRPRPYTVLATFDYLGNGVVFDHGGKIRMKYNQTEGVVLDRSIGPPSHWKWHTLNDPPVLQQVMIDTQMTHKDPDILKFGPQDDTPKPDNKDMLAIEFDNFIKEKSKKLKQVFKPFQIKMKVMKINENFSLKVLDQANVYLIFRDGTTNIKLNLGMVLDHREIVDIDTAEVGEVCNSLERFPARTDSLAAMQRSVAYAQHLERAKTERERRLRLPGPSVSVDVLRAACSRPLQPPLRSLHSATTSANTCKTINRRPPCCNNYYNDCLL